MGMRVWCLQCRSSGGGAWHSGREPEVGGEDAGGETECEETARKEDEGSRLMAIEREATLLDVKLGYAKRAAMDALDYLGSARNTAQNRERFELAQELALLWQQQQQIAARLIQIVSAEGPVEAGVNQNAN